MGKDLTSDVSRANEVKQYWQQVAEQSVKKVWDNEYDDVYNELLEGNV